MASFLICHVTHVLFFSLLRSPRFLEKQIIHEPVHEISNNVAFRHVDSDEPLQPPFKLRNIK